MLWLNSEERDRASFLLPSPGGGGVGEGLSVFVFPQCRLLLVACPLSLTANAVTFDDTAYHTVTEP